MRKLTFYSHTMAAAAFPKLVLTTKLNFAPLLNAIDTNAVFALDVNHLSTKRRTNHDALTTLALVTALTAKTMLTSNVFHSNSKINTLLFNNLFALDPSNLTLTFKISMAALTASLALGPR